MHRSMKIPELIHIKQWTFSHELRFNLNIKTHSIEPNLSSTWHRITYVCIYTYGIESNALSKNKNRKFKQKESYTRRTNIYTECVTWNANQRFYFQVLCACKQKKPMPEWQNGKKIHFFLNMKEFFIESTAQSSPTTRIWWVV